MGGYGKVRPPGSRPVHGLRSYGRAIVQRDRDPVTDGDEHASTCAIEASEHALPGGDVTVDEMSDASFPASDAPARWT
jgi:3'-phosphoadenosine 5'-phosphosulfate (PAPS) 3'-phosphatase